MSTRTVHQVRFAELADFQRPRAPFSASLCDAFARRADLAALMEHADADQRLPALALAAVHDSVLAEPTSGLAQWYPDIAEHPRTDDVAGALETHVAERRAALEATVARRSLQTNDVGRCGLLLAAISAAEPPSGPIALVDVGCSAGLNLRLDRYRYRYEQAGEPDRRLGPESPVRLSTSLRGVAMPSRVPAIAARIGIDRDPVESRDEDGLRWLRACIWPDQADRRERFEAAVEIARRVPAELRTGDAVDALASAVGDAAGLGHPVVMHSWVINYLPPARRTAFVAEVDRLGRRGDLTWVFAEAPAEAPELPHERHFGRSDLTAVTAVTWRGGERTVHHLGVAHPHGYWLRAADAINDGD